MWPEIQTAKEENRRELKLSGSAARKRFEADDGLLDETIFQLTALNLLDINDTPLAELSPKVGELKNLQSLLLFRNKINTIPVEIGQLTILKVLDLSGNQIESIPVELNQLKQLTTLNLSANKLRHVDMSQLENLSVCNLAANELENFPTLPGGKDTHHLSEINLEKNSIKEIPSDLTNQAGLKLLNVADNKIELVPKFLTKCSKLKEINLKDNPLKDKRLKKLVEQCRSKQVLDYIEKHGHVSEKDGQNETCNLPCEPEEPAIVEIRQKITIIKPTESQKVSISAEAKSMRPYVLHCIIRDYAVTNMKRFLQAQNELHDNECGKRELATIATHDLTKIKGSVSYLVDLPENIEITPLCAKTKVTAAKYYSDLRQQAEIIRKEKKRSTYSGIHKFINLVEGKVFAFFKDEEKVISLPPLTNCDETKISSETRNMLLEVTSSVSLECCQKVMLALVKKMLLLDVQVSRSHAEGKKKAKGKEITIVTYDKPMELILEQVRLQDTDGNFLSVYPGQADLVFPAEEKIDVVFK